MPQNIVYHGMNSECPDVRQGKATHCPGHFEQQEKAMRVVIRYGDNGAEREPLSARDLEIISAALTSYIHNSRCLTKKEERRAKVMALDFEILSELAAGE